MLFTCSNCTTNHYIHTNRTRDFICPECCLTFDCSGEILPTGFTKPVPEDMTPFKIGTKGVVENKKFEIVGRVRYEFESGYFNHWVIYLDDLTWMWLGEGYGTYAIFGNSDLKLEESVILKIKIGTSIRVDPVKAFVTTLIDQVTGFTVAGELPISLSSIGKFKLIEGSNQFNEFIGFKIYVNGSVESYKGRFAEYDDFNFSNQRELNDWV